MQIAAGVRFSDRTIRGCAVLATLFAVYTLIYLGQGALPGDPPYLEGWWGWTDQGLYLGAAKSFADGTWRTFAHFYPPGYPWFGSWFVRLWPAHPFFLVDFAGLALYLAAVHRIGTRWCGAFPTLLAIGATFALFPDITVTQWEIPWTTSLSSGIGGALLLLFERRWRRGWDIDGLAGWGDVAVFGLLYGLLPSIRPLDFVVWTPLGLAFFGSLLWRQLRPPRAVVDRRKTVALIAISAVVCVIGPALYVAFNLITSGLILGTYYKLNAGNGYQFGGFLRKAVSLLLDSAPVYVEPGQDIASAFCRSTWLHPPRSTRSGGERR